MKSGTGDDPFADPFAEDESDDRAAVEDDPNSADEPDTEETKTGDTDTTESAAADDVDGTDADTETADTDSDTATPSDEPSEDETDAQGSEASSATEKPDDSHIPWVLRRSSVKDDRPNITQFFLRDETDRAERGLRSDVEQILDKDVYTLDLREAAYLVAMEHPEEVAETLRDWGYDYLD